MHILLWLLCKNISHSQDLPKLLLTPLTHIVKEVCGFPPSVFKNLS